MSGNDSNDPGDDGRRIYHRRIEPEADDANLRLVRLVANLEHRDPADLPPLFERIDDLVADFFSTPPTPEAQAALEFSYAGYRIKMDQSGDVSLMKLADR